MKNTDKDLIHASDLKCVECREPADAFWPAIDPDIPKNPYCRKCLDRIKSEVMIELFTDNPAPSSKK